MVGEINRFHAVIQTKQSKLRRRGIECEWGGQTRIPGKLPFEQRLYLGKESSRKQEQKVQRPKVVAFTQDIYNAGESLFSDIWVTNRV